MTVSTPLPDDVSKDAEAIEINVREHGLSSVTVYQTDRAAIERAFPVKLKTGQNRIVLNGLPVQLDADSIRVEALHTSKTQELTVFDVVHKPPAYSTYSDDSFSEGTELGKLSDQLAELQARLLDLELQEKVLNSFANGLNGAEKKPDTTTLESYLDILETRSPKLFAQKTTTRKDIRRTEKQMEDLQKKANDEEQNKRATTVTVVLLAVEDGGAELLLSYVVGGASWTSLYDLRADVSDPKMIGDHRGPSISLHYRASITQTTGEDWENISLILSTASPLIGSTILKLKPNKMTTAAPSDLLLRTTAVSFARSARKSTSRGSLLSSSKRMSSFGDDEAPGSPFASYGQKLETYTDREVIATAQEGVISSTFIIDGLSSIPSDSASHKVSIVTIDMPADLEWVAVPRQIPSAFLRCQVKNNSRYALIAGPSNIFLDSSFVCKSSIADVAPSESFSCSLGVDPAVRVTYHPASKASIVKSVGGGGFFSNNAVKTKFVLTKQRITIKNTRPLPIRRLLVHDQVPISEDEKLKFVMINPPQKDLGPVEGTENDSSAGEVASSLSAAKASGSKMIPGSAASAEKQKSPTLVATVSQNVIARWVQKSEDNGGSGGSNGDGIIEWIGTDVKDTLDLELSYEMSHPLYTPARFL